MTPTSSAPSRMSPVDVAQAQSHLHSEFVRLGTKLAQTRADSATDLRSTPASGDSADVGDRTSQVEHDAAVFDHEQMLLQQTGIALQRIQDGTYETCASCTNLIGAARLQAFPRATMCLDCRKRTERHR